jgi:hypothetical protein
MTALAPLSTAWLTIISKASERVCSQSSEKSVMFPPTIVWSDAPIVPKTEREGLLPVPGGGLSRASDQLFRSATQRLSCLKTGKSYSGSLR